MDTVHHIEDDCLVVHAAGPLTLVEARHIALDAIGEAKSLDVRRVLFDFSDAEVTPIPTLAERFEIVREWADAAPASFTIAIAAREELLDRDRIGQIMASRLGLQAHVFEDPVDALLWVKRNRVPRALLLDNPLYH
ncbi:hypothetical protein [Lysobacter claricitrinus]|uniref:hypothetical protein n=1 Tax=Lysobacter claricitrinus TaxID=3367728 RepID=UPI0037DBF05F